MRLANSDTRSSLPPFLWFLLIATLFGAVCANTEIVNFAATLTNDVGFSQASNWFVLHHPLLCMTSSSSARPVLSDGSPEYLWHVQPAPSNTPSSVICETRNGTACTHEIWAVLDLDSSSWSSFRKFTLRISWPAYVSTTLGAQPYTYLT
jgi:hypothetical protein